jgi:hypothetical protein
VVALGIELPGEPGPDAAAADDDHPHSGQLYRPAGSTGRVAVG